MTRERTKLRFQKSAAPIAVSSVCVCVLGSSPQLFRRKGLGSSQPAGHPRHTLPPLERPESLWRVQQGGSATRDIHRGSHLHPTCTPPCFRHRMTGPMCHAHKSPTSLPHLTFVATDSLAGCQIEGNNEQHRPCRFQCAFSGISRCLWSSGKGMAVS